MMVSKIEFYAYLPKILIYFFSFQFKVGSRVGPGPEIFPAKPDPDPWQKMLDSHPWPRRYPLNSGTSVNSTKTPT